MERSNLAERDGGCRRLTEGQATAPGLLVGDLAEAMQELGWGLGTRFGELVGMVVDVDLAFAVVSGSWSASPRSGGARPSLCAREHLSVCAG
jgi:hypothetical protein